MTRLLQLVTALDPPGVLAATVLAAGCAVAASWRAVKWQPLLLRWEHREPWARVWQQKVTGQAARRLLGFVAEKALPAALGALSGIVSIAIVQVPLQAAAARWTAGVAPTASAACLGLLPVFISGLVQEPTKLLMFLAASGLLRLLWASMPGSPSPARTTPLPPITVGLLVGAGYGAVEASIFLSTAFSAITTRPELGPPALAIPVAERALTGLFHVCSAGTLAWAWGYLRLTWVKALAIVTLLHALLNYLTLLYGAGIIRIWWAEGVAGIASLSLLTFLRTRLPH